MKILQLIFLNTEKETGLHKQKHLFIKLSICLSGKVKSIQLRPREKNLYHSIRSREFNSLEYLKKIIFNIEILSIKQFL